MGLTKTYLILSETIIELDRIRETPLLLAAYDRTTVLRIIGMKTKYRPEDQWLAYEAIRDILPEDGLGKRVTPWLDDAELAAVVLRRAAINELVFGKSDTETAAKALEEIATKQREASHKFQLDDAHRSHIRLLKGGLPPHKR